MNLEELKLKITDREAVLGVIGLGYVGLPLACILASLGYQVIGVDLKPERVKSINAGICPIEGDEPGLAELLTEVVAAGHLRAACDYGKLSGADIITINVETPVDESHRPRYEALRAACASLGPVMKSGALVIVESTVAPGTVGGLVNQILEETSGRSVNEHFYLGVCPERVMPGKLLANLKGLSRVCGGSQPEVAQVMNTFYRQFVSADLDTSDIITAEVVKTTENAYRDVQIAFANEVALICEAAGTDVWRVRELVNKSPYRQMHLPGAGVGGHCIPKDPWLLAYAAEGSEVSLRLIPAARTVNDYMPLHMAHIVQRALAAAGLGLRDANIVVLGYAYLEDSDDTRNSPSEALVAYLTAMGARVTIHDPYVAGYQGDLEKVVEDTDVIVLMVRHHLYLQIDLARLPGLMHCPILVDGRGAFNPKKVRDAGLSYWAIGVGQPAETSGDSTYPKMTHALSP